jgi:putative membrane protein
MTTAPPTTYAPMGSRVRRGPGWRRWLYLGLAAIMITFLVVLVLVLVFPNSFGYGSSGPLGGGFRIFGGLLLVVFVLWIALWVVRISMWSSRGRWYGSGPGGGGYWRQGPQAAVHIARMRYARGEITREQFEQIMQDLERRPLPPQ